MGHKSSSVTSACIASHLDHNPSCILGLLTSGMRSTESLLRVLDKALSNITHGHGCSCTDTTTEKSCWARRRTCRLQFSPYVNDGAWLNCLLYLMLVRTEMCTFQNKALYLKRQAMSGRIDLYTRRLSGVHMRATRLESSLYPKKLPCKST